MSDVRSALPGAAFEGGARIEEAGPRGMLTLRGDLSDQVFRGAVTKVAGVEMPGTGAVSLAGEKGLCWMSPDEILLLLPYDAAAKAADEIGDALRGTHHLVANVSDARASFTVAGPAAREVIAKLSPADLHPSVFGPGQIRRTRLAQVPAAFWMRDETVFEIICFRSVAAYVFGILAAGSRRGAEVGYF